MALSGTYLEIYINFGTDYLLGGAFSPAVKGVEIPKKQGEAKTQRLQSSFQVCRSITKELEIIKFSWERI